MKIVHHTLENVPDQLELGKETQYYEGVETLRDLSEVGNIVTFFPSTIKDEELLLSLIKCVLSNPTQKIMDSLNLLIDNSMSHKIE